jgi:hypothetical protein
MAACQARPTYLDKYYALQPGRPNGAKRLIVLLPLALREQLPSEWGEEMGRLAAGVWRVGLEEVPPEDEMEPYEFAWAPLPFARPTAGEDGVAVLGRVRRRHIP